MAVVTGAGRDRVGRRIAEAMAGAGYDVALHYRTSAREAEEGAERLRRLGAKAETFGADLSDEGQVDAMAGAVMERFGRVDAVAHCAGIWEPGPLEDATAGDVRRHFEANVLSTFLVGRRFGLLMVSQAEGGCVVAFGDWAEVRPAVGYAAYWASKGAIGAMVRSLAVELGTRNPRVRVNAILPGPVTPPPGMTEEEGRRRVGASLVGREGTAEDVASAVMALVGNTFVTGVCLPVDGGRTVFGGR